jgi:hypothetical protein
MIVCRKKGIDIITVSNLSSNSLLVFAHKWKLGVRE